MKSEKPLEPDVSYVVNGRLLKKIVERKIIAKVGELNATTDKDGNVTLSFANVRRCLLVDSGQLRYGYISIRFE